MRENQTVYTRRDFVAAAAAASIALSQISFGAPLRKNETAVSSPDGQVRFFLETEYGTHFNYRIALKNKPVIETSRIGIAVDGIGLSSDAEVRKIESYRSREKYAWRGVHSVAVNHYNGLRIHSRHRPTGTEFTIEIRAFNDGVGFRHIVPGNGRARVPDEASAFVIPDGGTAWFHDFYGHYEGTHNRKEIGEIKNAEWAAPPVTIKLPNGSGYAAITEAGLMNYAGMGLQADGERGFRAVLGHSLPISHPYELRYSKEDAVRLSKPALIDGTVTTPWRVIMIGSDLNALVNSDVIHNLAPPPDKKLFPAGFATEWLRPGRAVWRYLDGGENTLDGIKEFSRLAGELGFEHNIVEGFWRRWTEDQMRELTDYSKQFNVGVWFWEHSRNLKTDESRENFFGRLNRVGVIGAKIDFFDHEAKEVIDQYHALLRAAAEHKIMLEFHGSNKPTGESRTFPNELTRESVKGMEYRSLTERARHNTTLPFTSFLAGHADYTPVHFGERRRETSWAHQIATAAVFTSPLMVYGAHPKTILENPAVEIIKAIPSTWDETIVLSISEVGELAAFARRNGKAWYLAILNGPSSRSVKIPLSFLGGDKYSAMLVRDKLDEPAAVDIERLEAKRADSLSIDMRAGGGFIGRFVPVAAFADRRGAR